MASGTSITKGEGFIGRLFTRAGVTFADNTTIDTRGIYGQTSTATSTGTGTLVSNTYIVLPVSGTLDSDIVLNMTNGTASTFSLKNTSGLTRIVDVSAQIIATTTSSNVIGLAIGKAGTVIPASAVSRTYLTSHVSADLTTRCLVSLAADEEVQLFVANLGATNAVTVSRARLTVCPV